jgi:hypothetical protein
VVKINKWLLLLDLSVLLAFSYGGVKFHYVGGSPATQVLRIVWPFALAFLLIGIPLGAYRLPRSGKRFAWQSSILWLLGMGGGFVIRALTTGASPSPIFVKIALAFTGVCLLMVRGSYWMMSGAKPSTTGAGQIETKVSEP